MKRQVIRVNAKALATAMLALALAFGLALTGCEPDVTTSGEPLAGGRFDVGVSFNAKILEISGNYVLVEPLDAEDIFYTYDRISFRTDKLDDIGASVGDIVTIIFNGETMESMPPQIEVISWSIYVGNGGEGDPMVGSVIIGEGTQFFKAEILTIKRNPYYAIVKPLKDEALLAIADQIFFETSHLGDGGFQTGDYITVQYTGIVYKSYPAGIDAVGWSVYCEL